MYTYRHTMFGTKISFNRGGPEAATQNVFEGYRVPLKLLEILTFSPTTFSDTELLQNDDVLKY